MHRLPDLKILRKGEYHFKEMVSSEACLLCSAFIHIIWLYIYARHVTNPFSLFYFPISLTFLRQACQTASWKHSHKWECKVYKRLYPQVLPNTARMILQILLRRKHSAIAEADWNAFLRLQHHMAETEAGAAKGSEYLKNMIENLQLMARAGKEYSESQENLGLIETLVGRVRIPLFWPAIRVAHKI